MARTISAIDVGIYVDGEPERLDLTLRSLRLHGPSRVHAIVLADTSLGELQCDAPVVKCSGGAAAFNTLLRVSSGSVVMFLENGARVPWGAIDRLERAVRGNVAIAGPSTNTAWNEQSRPNAPGPFADDQTIDKYARSLALLVQQSTCELSPLHSLGDFCYLARRDALLTLGGADEGFGAGPCWEMELNVRANRAGYRGLWVKAAYVHRAPISDRRRALELALLKQSKHRYQDRHCGARLRGEKTDYRDHCRGDACPNFSPRDVAALRVMPSQLTRPTSIVVSQSKPLISCILPTRDRPLFVIEAVKNFLGQDYPKKELVIVDDGENSLGAILPADDRIKLVELKHRLPVGEKRNVACAHARGEFIAHFDDDDWYPSNRLQVQISALVEQGAEVIGTSCLYFFAPKNERAWLYSFPDHRWVAGSTLLYRRSYWSENPFASVSIGEDSRFIAAKRNAVKLVDLSNPDLCVAMLHSRNTSPKRPEAPLWKSVASRTIRRLLGGRLLSYRGATDVTTLPLVSCVMATYNRPWFVELAVAAFEAQSYSPKELIVVDDGTMPVEYLTRERDHIHYHRLGRRASIGAKRNLANSLAQGGIICLWDDDDWYSPQRVCYQTLPILYDECDLTGIQSAFLLSLSSGEVWSATAPLHRCMFEGDVAGGTLTYRRAVAERITYPNTNLGEDASYLRRAVAAGFRLKCLNNEGQFIYMRHDENTWMFEAGSFIDPNAWQRSSAPPLFNPTVWASYQAAQQSALQKRLLDKRN